MKNYLFLTVLLLLSIYNGWAQCNPKEYTRIFNEANELREKGEFIEAKNRFEAAKIYACNKKEKDAADGAVDRLFEEINQLRQEAQIERDRANTLAGYFQFKFNRSWAFKDGKYAIIDTKGLKITDFIFNSIKQFSDEGYAEVQLDGQKFIIDTMGVISEGYTKIDGKVYKGLRKVERNGKFSYVDKTGSRPNSWGWYDYVELLSSGLGFAYKDDTLIIINRNGIRESILNTGKLIEYEGSSITLHTSYGNLKYTYESPGLFIEKKESKNKKNVYEIKIYNHKKEMLYTTSVEYLYLSGYSQDVINQMMGLDFKIIRETRLKKYFGLNLPIDIEGVLNHQGVFLPTKFKSIVGSYGYNTLSFGKDGVFKRPGYIHRNGKIIVNPYRYPQWKLSSSNYRIEEFRVNKKSGVVNEELGEILIQPIYKDIFFTSCKNSPYTWYRKNRKWGLLSPEGKVLTKPMYKIPLGVRLKEDWGNSADYPTYSPCDSSEIVWVKRGHRWTVINGYGTELFAPIKIKEPNGGGYWLKKGNKFALMYNRLGEFNTPFMFKHVIDFKPGQSFTFAWNKGNYYIVDTSGKYTRIKDIQLSPNINFIKNYNDTQRGHYSSYRCHFYSDIFVIPDKKIKSYVIIDKYGNIIDRSLKYQDDRKKFFYMSQCNDSTIHYRSNYRINSVFIIHKNGKIKFKDMPPESQDIGNNLRNVFDSVAPYVYNGLYVVGNKNKFGIVNSSGESKTSMSYSKIEPFNSNGALFYLSKDDEQWYIINSKFETYKIGDKQHDYHLKEVGNNLILEVEIGGARGICVDTLGQVGLWVEDYEVYNEAYIKFKQNGKWGVADIYGKVLLKPDFDKIDQMNNGMAIVNIEDLFGYVNDKWEYVIPAKYDMALSFMPDGMASVVLLGNSFFVDKNGKIYNNK